MYLIYPFFLIAGLVLVIPILIHLLNLRRFKTVYYSDISLLKELVVKTKKSKKIKEFLILVTRLVLLGGLVLAFSYPFISRDNDDLEDKRVIFIDNSRSVDVYTNEGYLLDQIKHTSFFTDIVTITYNYVSNSVKVLNDLNEEKLTSLVAESRSTAKQVSFNDIVDMSEHDKIPKSLLVFSPFAKSFNLDSISKCTNATTLVHFDSKDVSMINIDTLWVEGVQNKIHSLKSIHIDFTCYGDMEGYEFKLIVNDELRGVKEITSKSGHVFFESYLDEPINRGEVKCYDIKGLEISTFYFIFKGREKPKVSLVGLKPNSPLSKAFLDEEDFNLKEFSVFDIQYNNIVHSDLVFINYVESDKDEYDNLIELLVENQVKTCVFFNEKGDSRFLKSLDIILKSHNDNVDLKVDKPSSSFYKDVFINDNKNLVDYPLVKTNFVIEGMTSSLLNNELGESLLAQSLSEPNIYISTIDFSVNSSFTNHSLFIPTVYQFLFINSFEKELYSRPGEYLELPNYNVLESKIVFKKYADTALLDVPLISYGKSSLLFIDAEFESGFYEILTDSATQLFAINEKISEGQYEYRTLSELEDMISAIDNVNVISSIEFNTDVSEGALDEVNYPLWKYFIIMVIVFLIVEMLLLKYRIKK